jgi:Rps23 Pro-64 3,4-dihydroxylase Tpa1-like proline 4-hydroxylase
VLDSDADEEEEDTARFVNPRAVTLITYANAKWRVGDGGELRWWSCKDGQPREIAPRGGQVSVLLFINY